MINDLVNQEISISRKQMMDLIIDQKDVIVVSKKGIKITISKPISFVYKVNPKTKLTSYSVTSKITHEIDSFIGIISLSTEDNKSYTGIITVKKEG